MRCVKVEKGEEIIITVERKFLWMRKHTQYKGQPITHSFYRWMKLPELTLVDDRLSFQLDAWFRNA